jgi:hypothetical protein
MTMTDYENHLKTMNITELKRELSRLRRKLSLTNESIAALQDVITSGGNERDMARVFANIDDDPALAWFFANTMTER